MPKQHRKTVSIAFTLIMALSLPGCSSASGTVADSQISPTPIDRVIISPDPFGLSSCVCESGIVYFDDHLMKYLDYETNTPHLICSRPNCKHSDESCLAWFDSPHDVSGLVEFGGFFYVIKFAVNRNTYDLIRMDIGSSTQKVAFSLNAGDYSTGSWRINNLPNSVYYAGSYAWLELTYQLNEGPIIGAYTDPKDDTQIIGINLEDGSFVSLFDLSSESEVKRSVLSVSKDYLVIEETRDDIPLLSETEFTSALNDGNYRDFKDTGDPYFSYVEWHEQNKTVLYSYMIYDVSTGVSSVFISGEMTNQYDNRGSIMMRRSPYLFHGFNNGCLVYSVNDYNKDYWFRSDTCELFYHEPKTKASESIFKITNGSVLCFESNNAITLEGDIRYLVYTDHETALFYRYSLVTNESVELFEDVWNITFRVQEETESLFIGSMLKDSSNSIIYYISKDDYYAGQFDSAVLLKR